MLKTWRNKLLLHELAGWHACASRWGTNPCPRNTCRTSLLHGNHRKTHNTLWWKTSKIIENPPQINNYTWTCCVYHCIPTGFSIARLDYQSATTLVALVRCDLSIVMLKKQHASETFQNISKPRKIHPTPFQNKTTYPGGYQLKTIQGYDACMMCINVQEVLLQNHAQRQIPDSWIFWANIPDTARAHQLPPFAETSGGHSTILFIFQWFGSHLCGFPRSSECSEHSNWKQQGRPSML